MHSERSTLVSKGRLSRRQWLQRTAAAGAGLACAGPVACSSRGGRLGAAPASAPAASSGPPQSGGSSSFYLQANPSLDPKQHADLATNRGVSPALSRLFRYRTGPGPNTVNAHDLENDLALSAESPDALTWTIELRPNARFHDIPAVSGHAVEAEDIRATFQRALRLPTNSLRGLLGMIDPNQIQTPAPDTAVFTLSYPYAPFAKLMVSPNASWILPREASAGSYDPAKQLIGSGPFTLASAQPDVAYVYRRNPNWFEAGRSSPISSSAR